METIKKRKINFDSLRKTILEGDMIYTKEFAGIKQNDKELVLSFIKKFNQVKQISIVDNYFDFENFSYTTCNKWFKQRLIMENGKKHVKDILKCNVHSNETNKLTCEVFEYDEAFKKIESDYMMLEGFCTCYITRYIVSISETSEIHFDHVDYKDDKFEYCILTLVSKEIQEEGDKMGGK